MLLETLLNPDCLNQMCEFGLIGITKKFNSFSMFNFPFLKIIALLLLRPERSEKRHPHVKMITG